MKRTIVVLLVIAMTLTMMVGCAPKTQSGDVSTTPQESTSSGTQPSKSTETPPKEVEISFWHGETQPVRVAGFQSVIDAFEAANPNIKVTQSAVSNAEMFTKMVTALATNTNPEMTATAPERTMAYRKLGHGIAVDDLVKEIDAEHKYVSDNPKNLYFFDDHYWSVPLWSITIMLYYREDLLKEAGFNGPPKTWDDMLAISKKLTKDGNYGMALPASSGQNCTDQAAWSFLSTNKGLVFDQNGEISFNSPQNVETYTFLKELSKYSPPDSTGWSWAETKLAFTSGKAAMAPLFGSILLDLEKQAPFADSVKATSIPISANGEPGGNTHTEGMMVFTEDPDKQAACFEFIKFFMSKEIYGKTLANLQPGLCLPVTETGMNSKEYFENPTQVRFKSIIDAEFNQVKTGSLYGFKFEKRSDFAGEIGVSFLLGETLQRVVSGQLSPADAVKWGEEQMIALTK